MMLSFTRNNFKVLRFSLRTFMRILNYMLNGIFEHKLHKFSQIHLDGKVEHKLIV